jgi:hypothetical protein
VTGKLQTKPQACAAVQLSVEQTTVYTIIQFKISHFLRECNITVGAFLVAVNWFVCLFYFNVSVLQASRQLLQGTAPYTQASNYNCVPFHNIRAWTQFRATGNLH